MTSREKSKAILNDVVYIKGKPVNIVKYDGQMKEIVKTQKKWSKLWEKNWGFLKKEEVKKMYQKEAETLGLNPNFIHEREKFTQRKKYETLPDKIKLKESPQPIPLISSGMIGWRSSLPDYSLETAGPMFISPLTTADPPLSENDVDLKQQKFIILG